MRFTSIGLDAAAVLAVRVMGPAWKICALAVIATVMNLGVMGSRANAEVLSGTVTDPSMWSFEILSPPPTDVGADNHNDPILYAFDELQDVVLASDLSVDGGTIPAGTVVDSHYVFFDPTAGVIDGNVTFDGAILGVISTTPSLNDSDPILGWPETNYNSPDLRGLESNDFYSISGDTVTVHFSAGSPGDYIRVVTSSPLSQITGFLNLVQTVNNPVPSSVADFALVAEKDMVVRAFVLSPAGSTPLPVVAMMCIDKDSSGNCAATIPAAGTPQVFPLGHPFTQAEYDNAQDSLNFFVRGTDADTFLRKGIHNFEVEIFTGPISQPPDLVLQASGEFRGSRALANNFLSVSDIDILTVAVTVPADPNTTLGTVSADPNLVAGAHRMMQAVYPLDEDRVRNRPISGGLFTDNDLTAFPGQIALLTSLTQSVFWDLVGPSFTANTFAVGIVPARDGLNATMGNLQGFTFPGYPTFVTIDFNVAGLSTVASTTAHETGHKFGLGDEYCDETFPCTGDSDNPPPQTVIEGNSKGNFIQRSMGAFDVGGFIAARSALIHTPAATPAADFFGFMGSGKDVNSWVTPMEYGHLYLQLTVPLPSGFSLTAEATAVAALAPRDVVRVGGIVDISGFVQFDPFQIANTGADIAPPAGTDYGVEFRDISGNLLAAAGFDAPFVLEALIEGVTVGIDVDQSPFSLIMELPPGTESIAVTQDGLDLAVAARSPATPSVTISDFIVTNGDTADYSWFGFDGDADPLGFTLFYSPDGNEVVPLAVEIPDLNFAFSFSAASDTPPAPGGFLRVRASDGFNFSEDTLPLDDGIGSDAVALRRYGVRGPNLPGMCSRLGCVRDKRHTLVVQSFSEIDPVAVDLNIEVVSVPHASCTVNGVGPGGVISVATGINLLPGARASRDIDLQFACPGADGAIVGQDFVLNGRADMVLGLDLTPGDNAIEKTQTVK